MTRNGGRVKHRCSQCGRSVHVSIVTSYAHARDDARAHGWTFHYSGGRWRSTCPSCIAANKDAA